MRDCRPVGSGTRLSFDDFKGRRFFPLLDGIRAVAVIAVVAWHVDESRILRSFHGGRGVEWFFALSGFLITTLALREEERRGSVAIKGFFIRRAFRILPLYLIALGCTILADLVVFRNAAHTSGWSSYWPFYVTFLQDIPLNLGWANAPFHVAWSLGVEEKFYLLWPLLGFVLLRDRRRIACTAGLGVGLAICTLVSPHSAGTALVRPYLPIVLGCLMAMVLHTKRGFACVARLVTPLSTAAVTLAVVVPWPTSVTATRWYDVAYAVLAASAIGAFALLSRMPLLGSPQSLWIGKRSYAIYLFHPLAIRCAQKLLVRTSIHHELAGLVIFVIAISATFIAADILHRVIERPLIREGHRRSDQAERMPSTHLNPAEARAV